MYRQQERYLIGPGLRDKLREVIARVDGIPSGAVGGASTPVRLQSMPARGGSEIRLCKTTAAWNKGTVATVQIYSEGTPPNETAKQTPETLQNCVNKFANVAADKWVIVSRAPSGYWYLIAAEC